MIETSEMLSLDQNVIPSVAQNLENIIETQIQNIRTGGSSSPGTAQEQNQRPTSSCSSVEAETPLINQNAQVRLPPLMLIKIFHGNVELLMNRLRPP